MGQRVDIKLKGPAAVLDFVCDLAASTNGTGDSDWLAAGETISSHTVTADTGLTVDSSGLTDSNTSITAWLSGGTAGTDYDVVFQFTTSDSRTDEKTMRVKVRNR